VVTTVSKDKRGGPLQITLLVRLFKKGRFCMSDLEHARSLLEMARGDLNSLRGKRWSGLNEQQR
jgi:hypothetical protein